MICYIQKVDRSKNLKTNFLVQCSERKCSANGCLRDRPTPVCVLILFGEQQAFVTWSGTVLAIERLQSRFFDEKLTIVLWTSPASLDTMMGLLWVVGNCEAKWGQVMVTWYNCRLVIGQHKSRDTIAALSLVNSSHVMRLLVYYWSTLLQSDTLVQGPTQGCCFLAVETHFLMVKANRLLHTK